MPWELVVALIVAIGIFLYIKNSRLGRSTHKGETRHTTTEQCPDAAVDTKGRSEK